MRAAGRRPGRAAARAGPALAWRTRCGATRRKPLARPAPLRRRYASNVGVLLLNKFLLTNTGFK